MPPHGRFEPRILDQKQGFSIVEVIVQLRLRLRLHNGCRLLQLKNVPRKGRFCETTLYGTSPDTPARKQQYHGPGNAESAPLSCRRFSHAESCKREICCSSESRGQGIAPRLTEGFRHTGRALASYISKSERSGIFQNGADRGCRQTCSGCKEVRPCRRIDPTAWALGREGLDDLRMRQLMTNPGA